MSFFDEIYEEGKKRTKAVAWVFSDLQQPRYEQAKRCLDICMEDYEMLGKPAEMIWYLGDAVEGGNMTELEKMVALQENAFASLGIPLCYTMGNHDTDYSHHAVRTGMDTPLRFPFHDMVLTHENWHTTSSCEDNWFSVPFHNFRIFFFGDHMSKDGKWLSTHNQIIFGKEYYPYDNSHFENIRKEIAAFDGPVITAAHCAFPGGNRESYLNSLIQPLPLNVRLHLYGHSHIGEYNCPQERVFSQISWIDWQDIPQIDVASFENYRGSYCRSVILQIYDDDSMGIFFRNHDEHRFASVYFPPRDTSEKAGAYEKVMADKQNKK